MNVRFMDVADKWWIDGFQELACILDSYTDWPHGISLSPCVFLNSIGKINREQARVYNGTLSKH